MSLEFVSECAAVQYGDPDHLIIMFSSLPAVHKQRFDFKDFCKDLPQTFLFLRDNRSETMYHNGIPGLAGDVDEGVEFLRYFINKMSAKRVTMFGTSIGGYAALMYGYLLGVDDIVTAGTVSFLDPGTLAAYNGVGERIPNGMQGVVNFYHQTGRDPQYLDVWPLVQQNPDRVGAVKMYYTPGDPIDTTHTLHLARVPRVQAVPVPRSTHRYIAFMLMRDGTLAQDFATPVDQLIAPAHSAAIV